MSNFFKIIAAIFLMFFASVNVQAEMNTLPKTKVVLPEEIQWIAQLDIRSVEDILALTPKSIKAQTGKKLSLKETIALKHLQKKIKKETKKEGAIVSGSKSQLVALLLVIFVGCLGIHRFYLGYTTIGIIQLLTLGGCGIWALIDLIMIITGSLKPADGSDYDPKL